MTATSAPPLAALARDVLDRVRDDARLRRALDASRGETTLPPGVGWRDGSVAHGHAGIAVTCAVADRVWPGDGFARAGHRHLTAAATAARAARTPGASLFTGLAGIGFAAVQLDAGRGRYRRLLAAVDDALLPLVAAAVRRLERADGCPASALDLISGPAGTGAYLLARRADPDVAAACDAVLGALARLLADGADGAAGADDVAPRRWHTPAAAVGEVMAPSHPHGCHNCGLAHGMPGPLALLALAHRDGVRVDGMDAALESGIAWLAAHHVDGPFGPDWPHAVPLPGPGVPDPPPGPVRAAWCYGTAGTAHALHLAADALGDNGSRDLAVRAVTGILARPPGRHGLAGPTFCHGLAGLARIVARLAARTGDDGLRDGRDALLAELAAAFEPDSLLGYRSAEPGGVRVNHAGLLDGAPGVALVLADPAAADAPPAPCPSWDRLFLLA